MSSLSDEKLLKRASHASRNLGCLAVLTSLGAFAVMAMFLFGKHVSIFIAVAALGIGMIAAAYWILMVAAKQGDPGALTGPVIALGAQLCFAVAMMVLAGAKNPEAMGESIGGFIIPVLVLFVLYSNRKELLELKERGLWDKAFPNASPSGVLCLAGNILIAAGFLSMNGGMFMTGVSAGVEQASKQRKAAVFTSILGGEEKAFMEALQKAFAQQDGSLDEVAAAAAAEAATADMFKKLAVLKERVELAKKEAADNKELLGVLATYSQAVDLWQKGLEGMAAEGGDVAKGQQLLNQGDGLRNRAIADFNNAYAGKKKPY